MNLHITAALLIVALLATIAANLLSRRPQRPDRVWHLPYNAIQFAGILIAILMLAHLVTLLSGKPFAGRMG